MIREILEHRRKCKQYLLLKKNKKTTVHYLLIGGYVTQKIFIQCFPLDVLDCLTR